MKRKICVVITARTSYTKIKPILKALQSIDSIQLQIVCAASAVLERYGKVEISLQRDGFSIDERIYMILEAETLMTTAKSVGIGIIEFASVFDRLKPNVVMIMADRYEVMAPAIAASYQNITLAHVQGGEVTGNIDEKVRHSITKLADLHFPATERAKNWLIRMGEQLSTVYLTGCPSIDLAKEVISNPEIDFDIYEKYGGVGSYPDLTNGYYIVMQHPVTTEYENAKMQINETLEAMLLVNEPVLWFWPNPDAGGDETSKAIRVFREKNPNSKIHFIKNMYPSDFLRVLFHSKGIIGNSSVAIRECSFLGVPAVNIGSRQSNRERALNVFDVEYDKKEIYNAIQKYLNQKFETSEMYGQGNAGEKIAQIISKVPLAFSKSLNYINN